MKKIILFIVFMSIFMLAACNNGHKTIYHEYKDSTCSVLGNEAYYECEKCHKFFSDNHETEIPSIPTIEMKPHTLHDSTNNVGHIYTRECDCGYKEVNPILPAIHINTVDGSEIQGNRESAEYYESTVSITNCDDEYTLTNEKADVKVRGNYSANYEKKPYRIKFNSKQKMLGLNDDLKAKNWVLLAEYKDRTLLRNMAAFTMGNEILDEYTSDFRMVEVYVNETYRGLYLLCEQQQVNKGRVNISEPEEDYTGVDIGYFFEMDSYYEAEKDTEKFTMIYSDLPYKDKENCSANKFIKGYTIKSDIYSIDQTNFIKKTMNNIFHIAYDTLYNDHSTAPYKTLNSTNDIIDDVSIKSPEEAINKIIDVDSLVNVFFLNELCLDMDTAWSSFYMYYDMKGNRKLTFTAPWDFDSALGYSIGETDILISSYNYNSKECGCDTPKNYSNPWLLLFVNEEWFNNKLCDRWEVIKDSQNRVMENIDLLSQNYVEYFNKNFAKWTQCLRHVEANHGYLLYNINTSFSSSVDYLKKFINKRYTYLDTIFGK